MERMKKILVGCLLVLCVVGVGFVTMADVANATEMSAYEQDMKLEPLGTAEEEFVAVQPGGDLAEQCQSFCRDYQPRCVAIYYREDTSARCYYYPSYGFSLKSARGYNTAFKIWTK